MKQFLADTNVISVLAPGGAREAALIAWMEAHSEAICLSVVTVVEIESGIAKLRRQLAVRRAEALSSWLDLLLHLYAPRILPLDIVAARIAGRMSDIARAQGPSPGFADISIAATAERHGVTVLTRNVKHFVPLGVRAVNPFESLPA